MRFPILVLLVLVSWGVMESGDAVQGGENSKQVKIENVVVMGTSRGPVVLLRAENRVIPIFVDPTVAGSIEGALTGRKFPRPLSHDLMSSILQEFGGKVASVTIRLKEQVYFGELSVSMKGRTKVFDSRSSDAIALAIHFQAPIMVGKDLLESAGQSTEEQQSPQQML